MDTEEHNRSGAMVSPSVGAIAPSETLSGGKRVDERKQKEKDNNKYKNKKKYRLSTNPPIPLSW